METITDLLLARAGDENPGLAAGDERWSWDTVVGAGAQRAALLVAVRAPGPFHVAVLLDNVPEFAWWLGGTALSGAVMVGVNPTHRGPDLARDLRHTEVQVLVTDSRNLALVDGLDLGPGVGTVSASNPRVLVTDSDRYRQELDGYPMTPAVPAGAEEVTPESLGYLIFTSGTSGAPKACRCTHGRLARIGVIVAQMLELTGDDVCYLPMPMFHSNALMAGWAPALAGGATVALPSTGRFSASRFLPDIRRYGATYFNYVGKPLSYVLATAPQPDDADNTLRRVFGNEAAQGDITRFAERFGCVVIDSYGSTEGGAVVQRTPDTPPGALGRGPQGTMVVDPVTGERRAVARFDDSGRLVNPEESIGELVSMEGGAGFEGYWHNEEAETARSRNGWYWTGDLAYQDDNGFFYFAGRSDDWLRVDGENFAAAPVTRILERHRDVVVGSVYAVPDPAVGDQVMAALELCPGARFDPVEFARFLDDQADLGTKCVPRFIRVCDALPITATSKVLVRTLRAERWNCDDPVWWRPGPGVDPVETRYRRLEAADVAALERPAALS